LSTPTKAPIETRADDVSHCGAKQEGSQLVQQRSDHLGPLAFAERLAPFPKAPQLLMALLQQLGVSGGIGQKLGNL
jgi:hypothetical protein